MKKIFSVKLARVLSVLVFAAAASAAIFYIGSQTKREDKAPPEETVTVMPEVPKNIFIGGDVSSELNADELLSQIKKDHGNSVLTVSNTAELSSDPVTFPGAGLLASDGYYTTNVPYTADSCIIAKMTPEFDIPYKFSVRNRTVYELEYKQLSDYSKFTAEYTETEQARPAIELYMGYMFIDNGESLDIYSKDGRRITSFSDENYIPAYTRDRDGNPLFYKMGTVESGRFDCEGVSRDDEDRIRIREPHKKDKTVIVKGKIDELGEGNPVTEEVKVFYRLSGSSFVAADYDDMTEGRGLYFDYPSYYGITDGRISMYAEKSNTYKKDIDGKITFEHDAYWNYKLYDNVISDRYFDRVYNFNEGLGCVLTEEYYQDGGLYFIKQNGARAFNTVKRYRNNMGWYVIENILPPISNGPESIGYFYYDHGLVRVRREIIDFSNYETNNTQKVYSSEEILIDTSGNVYPTPVGYDIKAYSDGMILLERDGLYGFMDYSGKWIAQPIYTDAEAFSEGLAVIGTADGRYGMIDTSGNIVVPFAYTHISSCSDGVIAVYSEESGWHILRKMTV
ncbi:MAG: WG repeat-containing protein [Clostridiales bacterium]|nr:WG repeat-containing protein [Clostridiales bacterium]